MSDYLNIVDFLVPINRDALSNDAGYKDGQIGKVIEVHEEGFPDLDVAVKIFVVVSKSTSNVSRLRLLIPKM